MPNLCLVRTGMVAVGVAVVSLLGHAQAQPALTLDRVVADALSRNERATIAEAEAQAAASRRQRARAFFFPELAVTGAFTYRLYETVRNVGGMPVVIQRHEALNAQANLTVPLFDARFFPLYRQAKLEEKSAALQAAEDKRLLGFEVADAYLMVLAQQQRQQAAAQRVEFSQASLRDARARAEAGLVSSNDVTRGALEAANAARELAVARADVATARLQLGYLVGASIDGELQVPAALLADATKAPAAEKPLIDQAVAQRLDVAAGQSRTQALAAAATEPKLRALPTLSGVAQYRVTNEAGFSGRNGDGYAGLIANWSLFDGGERSAEASERRALARAGELEQAARVRGVALQVQSALVALANAQATQQVAIEAAELARKNTRETNELYRQGLVRGLEVADANLRLFEAEVALARDRYNLALAYLDLRAAVGYGPPGQKEPSR